MKFKMNKKFNIIITSILLVLAIVVTIVSGKIFRDFSKYEVEFKTDNVTKIEKFSDYSPKLKGTVGDSEIYVIEGSQPGPSVLIIGGTHPNEPSGQLTATLFLENISVTKGTVYIITEANKSAYTYSFPLEAAPMYYEISTPTGMRTFKYGTRATNTNEQWPNPDVYVHAESGQKLSSSDTRNLNRAYPGSENGTYTEKVAYAITQCIIKNNITMTIDLHEASPEYLTINTIISNSKAVDASGITLARKIATDAQLSMEFYDVDISTEDSPADLHGLSHRELGTYTDTLAFLCETSNASQGKIRGAFTADLITSGKDKFYSLIAKDDESRTNKILYAAPVEISERVARHALSIIEIINSYNLLSSNNELGKLTITGIPSYDNIMTNGIGYYL